jgi:D-sedoheptulose 7-phosphate isomerase
VSQSAVIRRYLSELTDALAAIECEPLNAAIQLLETARAERRTVFVFGNGGSATTASHIVCDLGKNTRSEGQHSLRMVCLAVDAGTLTAYANDEGYEASFAEPLRTLAEPDDVAIAVSASGSSPNVVRALHAAREIGLRTIGLTGSDGGKVPTLVDVCLRVTSAQIEQIEDVHLVINHLLTVLLRGGDEAR